MSSNQQGPIGAIEHSAAQAAAEDELSTGSETRVEGAHRALHEMVARGGSFSGRERNCAFLNTRDGAFADVSAAVGFDFADDTRAVLTLDYDLDGDVDVITTNRTAPRLRVLLNRSERLRAGESVAGTTFQLHGGPGNVDGIGATLLLTPEGDGGPIVRSVAAGSAFLGQGSPRLVVRAGDAARFADVTVLWPGGERQSFGPIDAGGAWLLKRGRAEADRLVAFDVPKIGGAERAPIEPSIEGPGCGGSTHAYLTVPEPLPPLETGGVPSAWRTLEGEPRALVASEGPRVVTLWSADCPLCAAELRAWKSTGESHAVLALSVDEVVATARDDEFDVAAVESAVDRFGAARALDVTFGLASYDLLDALQSAVDRPFARDEDLALPVTFVLDSDGSIAALHRGPVDPSIVAADLAFVASPAGADAAERRQRSTPFRGRWIADPPRVSTVALARTWIESGRPAAGGDVLLRAHRRGAFPAGSSSARPASRAAAEAARLLYGVGELERAVDLSSMVAEIRPEWPKGHFNRAVMLEAAGRTADAEAAYTRTLALRPKYWQALANRGLLRAKEGRRPEGRADLEAALEALPKKASAQQREQVRAMLDSIR